MKQRDFYLLHIIGDIEPEIRGLYKSEETRDRAALLLKKKVGDEDGIFMLDMVTKRKWCIPTIPKVRVYSAAFFSEECEICHGKGKIPCPYCEGEDLDKEPCYECNSKGTVPCPKCDGTGVYIGDC